MTKDFVLNVLFRKRIKFDEIIRCYPVDNFYTVVLLKFNKRYIYRVYESGKVVLV